MKKQHKKLPVDELTRLAFWFAEQDRASAIDCMFADDPHRAEQQELVNQLRAYRLKRWGPTVGDRVFKTLRPITIQATLNRPA